LTSLNLQRLDQQAVDRGNARLVSGIARILPNRPRPLQFITSNEVGDVLAATGRTEDVRFSPDNRWLVLAGYGLQHLLILRITLQQGAQGPVMIADDFMRLTSSGISSAHGLDFVDDHTLAVANRDGCVAMIPLPAGELAGRCINVDPLSEAKGSRYCKMVSPGSLAVRRNRGGKVSLLVCNNYIHRVTRHVVDPAKGYRVKRNSVLMERGLNVPDGIAVSQDGRWIAVSNHVTHEILLFDARWPLSRFSRPAAVLTGTRYPHGLRFTPDDRHLLVADAGAPVVNAYERGQSWTGSRPPLRTTTVLDDETFRRGHANPAEGGPKGIDIDRSGAIVAVTCEEQALAFFALESMINGLSPGRSQSHAR
jgi:hypothetical protein